MQYVFFKLEISKVEIFAFTQSRNYKLKEYRAVCKKLKQYHVGLKFYPRNVLLSHGLYIAKVAAKYNKS